MTTHDPPPLAIERTNTVLYCERWSETVAFYRSVMGLGVAFENDWFVEFELTASAFLSIADSSRATIAAVQGQGITLTWQVPELGVARAVRGQRHRRHGDTAQVGRTRVLLPRPGGSPDRALVRPHLTPGPLSPRDLHVVSKRAAADFPIVTCEPINRPARRNRS